jgi:hypothetical protein
MLCRHVCGELQAGAMGPAHLRICEYMHAVAAILLCCPSGAGTGRFSPTHLHLPRWYRTRMYWAFKRVSITLGLAESLTSALKPQQRTAVGQTASHPNKAITAITAATVRRSSGPACYCCWAQAQAMCSICRQLHILARTLLEPHLLLLLLLHRALWDVAVLCNSR